MLDLTKKIIVLDRDGVINEELLDYVRTPEDWTPIPGSLEAIALLKKLGFRVFLATNQSGIGRGIFTSDDLKQIHAKFEHLLKEKGAEVDGIYHCPHAPVDNCYCRKPNPGLLEMIMSDIGEDLKGVPFVGDSLRDLKAGWTVGCESILVKTGKGEYTIKNFDDQLESLLIYDDLMAIAKDFEHQLKSIIGS